MADTSPDARRLVDQLQIDMELDRANRQLLLADIAVRFAARDAAYDARLAELRRALEPPPPPKPKRLGHRSGMWAKWGSHYPFLAALEGLQSVDGQIRACDEFGVFGIGGTPAQMRTGLYKDQAAAVAALVAKGLHADVALRAFPTAGTRQASWPAALGNTHLISPTNPPGTGTPTRLDAVEVWRRAAQGFFADLWRAQVRAVKDQLGNGPDGNPPPCSFRPFWEGNWSWEPLSLHSIGSACWSVLETPEEIALFHQCQALFAQIIAEEYGEAGGLFLCPLKQGSTKANTLDYFNPDACKLVGIDYYDAWPTLRTEADFNFDDPKARINQRRGNGSPHGLGAWLFDVDALLKGAWKGRAVQGFKLGEWGVVHDPKDPTYTYSGGDNPLFVTKVMELLWRYRHIVVGASYFSNKDGAPWESRLQAEAGGRHPNSSVVYANAFAKLWHLSQAETEP